MEGTSFRQAGVGDADAIARAMAEGFETYRPFAPAGWDPPPESVAGELLVGWLSGDDYWCLIAERDGRIAGHVAFVSAANSGHSGAEPGLGHVRQVFVTRELWGSGLASELHRRLVGEATARGFIELRLFTPADQKRARGFYEREGWKQKGDAFNSDFGLPLVEYRLMPTPA